MMLWRRDAATTAGEDVGATQCYPLWFR